METLPHRRRGWAPARARSTRLGWLLCGTLLPAGAWAGGFESEYPDNGARVLGRGGAFVALADDASAIQYNPAGLARLHGVNLLLSVNLVDINQEFTPAADVVLGRSLRSFKTDRQAEGLIAAPMLAVQFDFEALPMLDFAVGIYGPTGTTRRRFANQWTIDQVTNASGNDVTDQVRGKQTQALAPNGILNEAQMLQAYPTIAVAWAVTPELRVGVSLQASFLNATIKKGIGGPAPGVVSLEVADWFTPTGILGVQYAPLPWLELGAMYRPSFQNEAEGTGEFRLFNECPNGACPTDGTLAQQPLGPYGFGGTVPFLAADGSPEDGVEFRFRNPDLVRLGARLVQPRFDVELDYLWQRNSVHKGFDIRFKAASAELPVGDGISVSPVPRVLDARYYEDTHGLRLGSDIQVLPELLTVRVGASYETGASPEAYTNLDFAGLDQWTASLGATVHLDWIDIDVGGAWVGFVSRSVTQSKVGIIDITLSEDQWKIVGNGDYSARYLVGGIGTRMRL